MLIVKFYRYILLYQGNMTVRIFPTASIKEPEACKKYVENTRYGARNSSVRNFHCFSERH